jgi:protein-tyrosine phosphatase
VRGVQSDDETFRLLYVCTGNVCRSPGAEILTRHLLRGRLGGREASRIEVASAGVRAVAGAPMHPDSRAALSPWALDIDHWSGDFRARQLSAGIVRNADLVLTATPRHRSAVLEEFPEMLGVVFSLREFARLVSAVDTTMLPPDLVKRARAAVEAARAQRGMVPADGDDRIPDPIGKEPEAYRDAISTTFRAVVPIMDVLAPR